MTLLDYLATNGLTLASFGATIRRNPATISRIARGLQWPDRDTLAAIVAATGAQVQAADIAATLPAAPRGRRRARKTPAQRNASAA